jgi:hypothetical protein
MNRSTKYNIFFFILFIISAIKVSAQPETIEMADRLREDGKIYVVVTVLLIIFAGFIGYLIAIDRKVKKLEKNLKMVD